MSVPCLLSLHVLVFAQMMTKWSPTASGHSSKVELSDKEIPKPANVTDTTMDRAGSTQQFSAEQLAERKVFYYSVIAGSVACVMVLGLLAAYLGGRQRSDGNDAAALDEQRLAIFHDKAGRSSHDGASTAATVEVGGDADPDAGNAALTAEAEEKQLNLVNKYQDFVKFRGAMMVVFFFLYVSLSVGIPILAQNTISCDGGFFWETHMIFLGGFILTKLFELGLYAWDPTLTGKLGIISGGNTIRGFFCKLEFTQGFLWKFCMSFLGYVDGYQDSTAIAIAYSCPDPFAQDLGKYMWWVYVIGVVFLQWVVLACLAFWEPTHSCFAKLLHMDAFATRLSIPRNWKMTWKLIQGARTIFEDIPQAGFQTLFVIYVRKNPFMILSICCAVMGSLMSLNDALSRALVASGFVWAKKPIKSIHVASGWAIHGVVFEREGGTIDGRLLENDKSDVALDKFDTFWAQTASMHQHESLDLRANEWVVEVKGLNCPGGYLCYELEFTTNLGRTMKFQAGGPDGWRGSAFTFKAQPGNAICNINFAPGNYGRCEGIEEMGVGSN